MCNFAIGNMRRMSPVDNTPLQKNAMNHHGVEEVLFCTFSSFSHSDEWYEAISWTGLQDSRAWEDFQTANPKPALKYLKIQNDELNLIINNKTIE